VDRLRGILDSAELRIRAVQRRYEQDEAELREVASEYGSEDE
jgi:hypothetical protein